MKYDYLVVGAGLYGAVFAYEAKKKGKTCLVIDKRDHIAGNIYCENVSGINVHKYGAHIFHTSDKRIWEYVNQFAEFNNYINSPVARYKNELYNLPFNMNTFSKMWNIATPQEAKDIIASQIADLNITEPKNLEEQALSLVGKDVYEKLIKGYTEKQWGRDCKDLPSFIIKRLPLRFIYDNIQYAEFNTKSDYCHVCGFDGEIIINDDLEWECPQCHNKDRNRMNVTRRTCGYLGENFWNVGKTKEINARVLHL